MEKQEYFRFDFDIESLSCLKLRTLVSTSTCLCISSIHRVRQGQKAHKSHYNSLNQHAFWSERANNPCDLVLVAQGHGFSNRTLRLSKAGTR